MAREGARLTPKWRRALLCAVVSAALSGCAHLPDWLTGAKPQPQAQSQPAMPPPDEDQHKPRPPHRPAHHPEPPAQQVAMVDPAALVGLKPPAITKLLGTPAKIAKDELSLVWTYAAEGCALTVYFYSDLKTADFHVLKYTLAGADGKPLEADAPCRQKLLAIRDNDTG